MVLFLHNRYRTTGGEERVVEDLRWLVRECLGGPPGLLSRALGGAVRWRVRESRGEPAELLARDSAALGARRAALGLLRGGLSPADVASAGRAAGGRAGGGHHPQAGRRV